MRALRRLLRVLITGSASLIIAACYGVPVMYGEQETRLRVTNTDGDPVPGLRVYPGVDFSSEFHTTDDIGQATFYPILEPDTGETVNPIVRDVDGDENLGCFERAEVELGGATEVEFTIAESGSRYSESLQTCRFVTEAGDPIPGLRVNLCGFGCRLDEFITDENGEVEFYPIIDDTGTPQCILVTDEDWQETLGFFGKAREIALGTDPLMEVVLTEEPLPGDAADPVEPAEEDNSGEDARR